MIWRYLEGVGPKHIALFNGSWEGLTLRFQESSSTQVFDPKIWNLEQKDVYHLVSLLPPFQMEGVRRVFWIFTKFHEECSKLGRIGSDSKGPLPLKISLATDISASNPRLVRTITRLVRTITRLVSTSTSWPIFKILVTFRYLEK